MMNYEIQDFVVDVIERSKSVPVLVDFWAPWCGPCKILGPVLERLAAKGNGDWALAKVNTDIHQDIAEQYGIRGIPNVKLFVDGKVVNEFTGALPEPMVVTWLKKALPNKYRKAVQDAEHLIGTNRVQEAQKRLEGVLAEDPENEQARVLLGRTYAFTDPEKASGFVKNIEEHSEHFAMAEAVRTITGLLLTVARPERLPDDPVKQIYREAAQELSRQNFEGALEKFLEVIRRNRSYENDGARMACLAIFRMLGDGHEITQKYRRPFSSALFV